MDSKSAPLKPQDVLLLLRLLACPEEQCRIIDLAHGIQVSASEVSHGLSRLQSSRLIAAETRKPLVLNAIEFLVHGLKYAFPPQVEAATRGIPTAHSAPPLVALLTITIGDHYVWAHESGSIRGHALRPLYPSVPSAALKCSKLYELLALCDAIRIGRVRERKLAEQELRSRILRELAV